MRRLLLKWAHGRYAMYAEAYGLALAYWPRWHPRVEELEEKYLNARDRAKRWEARWKK